MSTSSSAGALLLFISRNLIGTRDKNYRLTIKRLGILLLALVIYLPVELLIWCGFLLDEILLPGQDKRVGER